MSESYQKEMEQCEIGASTEVPVLLRNARSSTRLFLSLVLCLIGINYLVLLTSIYFDTDMSISTIIEAYASFGNIELIEHTFKYLPWFVVMFTIVTLGFFHTNIISPIKAAIAVLVPALIVIDVGSMWLVRYHSFFGWSLFAAGFLLAFLFLAMFLCIQRELWLKRPMKVT